MEVLDEEHAPSDVGMGLLHSPQIRCGLSARAGIIIEMILLSHPDSRSGAEDVGIVSRRANRDRLGRPTPEITKVVSLPKCQSM